MQIVVSVLNKLFFFQFVIFETGDWLQYVAFVATSRVTFIYYGAFYNTDCLKPD